MSGPKRIQMSRQRPWRAENPDAVRVDRTTRWGNPFRIVGGTPGHGGSIIGPTWFDARANWGRPRALEVYAVYESTSAGVDLPARAVGLFEALCACRLRDEPERFEAWIAPLRGRDVACWCGLAAACHGDVLLRVTNGGRP